MRSSWHPESVRNANDISLGHKTWGSPTAHCGWQTREDNTELQVGKEIISFQPSKYSQHSHDNFIVSLSHRRRMDDTVVHKVKNKFPGFYF